MLADLREANNPAAARLTRSQPSPYLSHVPHIPCPHIGGGVLSGGTISTPPQMSDHVFRINSHSTYSTSIPSHIAHLQSGGTFETLPVVPSSTRPLNQVPALSDDEKKRRVQRIQSNLLPSPQPQSIQPRLVWQGQSHPRLQGDSRHERSAPIRVLSRLQSHEYFSQDIIDAKMGLLSPSTTSTTPRPPPPDDPPALMEDITSSSDDDDHPSYSGTDPPRDSFMPYRADSSVNPSNVSEPANHTTQISIAIAYPADKVEQFASNLKQDAQIRSTMSSQGPSTMYPVLADAVEVVVPHPVSMPTLPTIVPSDVPTIQPRQRNRIQPTQVNTINKRIHFPRKVHAYFNGNDYPPDLLLCEREFLDNCIIQNCCQNDIMIRLPLMNDDTYINELRRFQTDNLLRRHQDTVAPHLWLEVILNYMEHIFIIQRSSIPNSGDGLYLLAGKTLPRNLLLPYPGTIIAGTDLLPNQLRDDDKYVCIRDNVYLRGSDDYFFPVTNNRYPNYLAKANELVCKDMRERNQGRLVTCGLVLFEEGVRGTPTTATEIFILYSPLTNTTVSLLEEPPHRVVIKIRVLMRLFDHISDCLSGIECYMAIRPQLKIIFNQLQDSIVHINTYRSIHHRSKPDPITRFIRACIAVVDGRFYEYLQHTNNILATAMLNKTDVIVNFKKNGQLYLPEALLLHIHTWFYYGNYADSACHEVIIQQGYAHHRNMILCLIKHGSITLSTSKISKLLLQDGIVDYTNPIFSIENTTYHVHDSSDDQVAEDESDQDDEDEDDDDVIASLSIHDAPASPTRSSPVRSSPTPTHIRTSPTTIRSLRPTVDLQADVPVPHPVPTLANRHEKADDNEVLPSTPLTAASQLDQIRQSVKVIMYEEGHLNIAPRYEAQQERDRHARTNNRHSQNNEYNRDDRSYNSNHSNQDSNYNHRGSHREQDRHSRSSVSTMEMEPGLHHYDPRTLPNTVQEAIRWTGINEKSYEYYLSVPYGKLSNHHLVKNNLDTHSQSTLYNDIMILTTILLKFWTVDISIYHRVDRSKNDFSLNDRAKITPFDEYYDGSTTCLYLHTSKLLQHYSTQRLPYVHLYKLLSQGTDLKGKAQAEWTAQVDSANSSLVPDAITNSILCSPALQCYQMRSMAELIVDFIVFRVLIFNQLKNKTSIRQELSKLQLISSISSVTYDGILTLSQKIIRSFRLFIKEENVVNDLVRTITGCIKNSGTGSDYTQQSVDFYSAVSARIQQFRQDQTSAFQDLDLQEQNIRIFAVIEMYCRELQDHLRLVFNSNGQSLAMTPSAPTYASVPQSRSYPSSTVPPSYRSRPSIPYKRVNIHSISPPQPHALHISERVDVDINEIHTVAQARPYQYLLDDTTADLPDGTLELIAEGATTPTIHIQVATVHDVDVKATDATVAVVDTKWTVDETPYTGICAICGDKKHDDAHCRIKSYKNPKQANLVNYSYFTADVLADKIRMASDHGFLRGATPEEVKWVVDKINELRNQRLLLYASRGTNYSNGNGYSNYPQRNSTPPPRSSSPYGYNRPPSPHPPSHYERQPYNKPNQSL